MKDPRPPIDRILETIRTNERFVLTTHVNPDGDAIGSELALYYHLKDLGKEARILNGSPLPDLYRFLDPEGVRVREYGEQDARTLEKADVLFLLDLSHKDRLGALGRALRERGPTRICIDHHPPRALSCDLAWIDDRAAATGELLFDLFKRDGRRISPAIAEALYVALVTDTGCFRYTNVTARTHRIAAELIEAGIDHHGIYRRVYESNSWNQSLLFARAIGALQRAWNDRVARTGPLHLSSSRLLTLSRIAWELRGSCAD